MDLGVRTARALVSAAVTCGVLIIPRRGFLFSCYIESFAFEIDIHIYSQIKMLQYPRLKIKSDYKTYLNSVSNSFVSLKLVQNQNP